MTKNSWIAVAVIVVLLIALFTLLGRGDTAADQELNDVVLPIEALTENQQDALEGAAEELAEAQQNLEDEAEEEGVELDVSSEASAS